MTDRDEISGHLNAIEKGAKFVRARWDVDGQFDVQHVQEIIAECETSILYYQFHQEQPGPTPGEVDG